MGKCPTVKLGCVRFSQFGDMPSFKRNRILGQRVFKLFSSNSKNLEVAGSTVVSEQSLHRSPCCGTCGVFTVSATWSQMAFGELRCGFSRQHLPLKGRREKKALLMPYLLSAESRVLPRKCPADFPSVSSAQTRACGRP